jgi:signal transduction histidine kinase
LLASLAEFYAVLAEERGASLDAQPIGAIEVRGDRALLQQAIANLLDNAIKFSPPEGVVRLAAAVVGGRVMISVADDGPGMPPADLARATERFFRGETARSTPGSGLGLALVQAVVQLHGGELRLGDNAPGLTARIVLPLPDRGRQAG